MVYFAKWKIALVAIICSLGVLLAVPNFVERSSLDGLPDWLPKQQVNLGLDLQGGSHLLLEVELSAVVSEYLEGLTEGVRADLRRERIRFRGLGVQDGTVTVTISKEEDVRRAREIVTALEPTGQVSVDGLRIELTPTDQILNERRTSAIQQSIEIVRRRIDETGTREPTIQRQGDDRILVQLPGVEDPERVKQLLGKTAKMTFHLVDVDNSLQQALAGRVPPGSRLMPHADGDGHGAGSVLIRRRVMVSGENLVDAQPGFDHRTNEPIVTFRFDSRGGQRFGKVTTDNVGRPFAIVLDGEVLSAPVIREPILGGSGQISGNFSVQSAQDLALLLRAGALPAPLKILEERSVGASLGADSIAAGKIASIIGLIGVIIFMGVAYGRFGVMADFALVFNMFLILGALSLLQATLTLPGIAGIVLTIGMAVDANVLIFERIREETRAGRTPISAIDAGYSRALTTIIDANVTTLIAAILLYAFGSGPIRGFAVTLAIGIGTSMFTAIMVTRLFVVTWLRRTKPQELPV